MLIHKTKLKDSNLAEDVQKSFMTSGVSQAVQNARRYAISHTGYSMRQSSLRSAIPLAATGVFPTPPPLSPA